MCRTPTSWAEHRMKGTMIEAKADLIRETVAERTGAAIALETGPDGVQKGLNLRFDDLTRNGGPLVTLRPSGLKRHRVTVRFGNYAAAIVSQMMEAPPERVTLARALVRSVDGTAAVSFLGAMNLDTWMIDGPAFSIIAERKVEGDRQSDEEIVETCETVIVPIMAALVELIGYDEAPPLALEEEGELEGVITVSTVRRRERNPRNRLLCLHIHGHRCAACGTDPRDTYGEAHGSVLEVHHLQPLSQLDEPRAYDPRSDLVPLCPTCHRVVHSRRPVPWSPAEVREMMYA